MPYKDPKKQKESQHRFYLKNKEKARENTRRRRKEYKQWFFKIRESLFCEICKENHTACLDFHHKDSSQKECTVSKTVNELYPKEKILKEIKKCIVLCSNCHRKLHWSLHKNSTESRLVW